MERDRSFCTAATLAILSADEQDGKCYKVESFMILLKKHGVYTCVQTDANQR